METTAKILLVDDDAVNRSIISRLFKRLGIKIDVAENGREAIQMLLENDYDLLLMDINMPEMDGIAASRYIRSKFTSPKKDIKIVAMTGYDSDADIRRFKQAGMDEYVSKPVVLVDFFKKLNLIPNRELPVSA